ncbi:MAG: phytanoyl-CoA dioxygenase family protein [Planctomycetes bacterium]|nr:phytanoyl-CoA dioxygenase family protein [Planctomycetota bacterium]
MGAAAAIEPTVKISQEQIDFFHKNGFLAVPSISTPEEIERLKVIYDRLFERKAGREEGNQFDLGGSDEDGKAAVLPQILNPKKYAPELEEGLFRVNALALARQLLGEAAQAHGEHAIFKPAKFGAATPWHQDNAYWSPDHDHCSLSVWMPLQPATLENGCMQFVPGSNEWEILPHHCINHDPRVHGLELDNPEKYTATAVPCPLPPGGATFHFNKTLHYAGPNRSDIPRRAYILGFGLPATKRAKPHDFYWNRQKQTPRDQRAKEFQKKKISAC